MTAVYCLIMKFPTSKGVGYIKADRTTTRKCHLNTLRILESFKSKQDVMKIVSDAPNIPFEQLDCGEYTFKPQPMEKTMTVSLVTENKERVTNVGSLLSLTEKD